jgi:hypothetical protein
VVRNTDLDQKRITTPDQSAMLAPHVVDEIRGLLREGHLSQRKIARKTGVSRGTVAAIASGRRPDYGDRVPRRSDEAVEWLGPLERCPGCGGMVSMPCRLCRARAVQERTRRRRMASEDLQPDDPLGLDLHGKDRLRYEQVRRQMLARQAAAFCPGELETDDPDEDPPEAWALPGTRSDV